jgi:hypothetical protein
MNFLNISAKIGKEDIFTPTIGNESLHEISDDNLGCFIDPANCDERSEGDTRGSNFGDIRFAV